eukprot:2508923-Pleurochrysis_carterae.AAC.1
MHSPPDDIERGHELRIAAPARCLSHAVCEKSVSNTAIIVAADVATIAAVAAVAAVSAVAAVTAVAAAAAVAAVDAVAAVAA